MYSRDILVTSPFPYVSLHSKSRFFAMHYVNDKVAFISVVLNVASSIFQARRSRDGGIVYGTETKDLFRVFRRDPLAAGFHPASSFQLLHMSVTKSKARDVTFESAPVGLWCTRGDVCFPLSPARKGTSSLKKYFLAVAARAHFERFEKIQSRRVFHESLNDSAAIEFHPRQSFSRGGLGKNAKVARAICIYRPGLLLRLWTRRAINVTLESDCCRRCCNCCRERGEKEIPGGFMTGTTPTRYC